MKNYVFCKYRNEPTKCINCHKRCPSISNILYGIIFKLPIIKQIYDKIDDIRYDKQANELEDTLAKYGDCEDEKIKLIFGVISYDDLCGSSHANLYTMNDLEVCYDKNTKKYNVSVETAYMFMSEKDEMKYIKALLSQFTKYMNENRLDTNYQIGLFVLFSGGFGIDCTSDSIEECYAKFKFMVEGYCRMWKKESEE